MYLRHKIRRNPNNFNGKKIINILAEERKPEIIDKRYKCIFISNLFLLTLISVFSFINAPLVISFRLFTPFLGFAIVSWFLLLIISGFQAGLLLSNARKFRPFHHLVILVSVVSFVSPIICIFAVALQVISYLFLNSHKKIIISSMVWGALSLLLIPVVGFLFLLIIGGATQLSKNDTTSYTIQDSDTNKNILLDKKDENYNKVEIQKQWLTAMTWNIGYASTGSEADYFYDTNNAGKAGSMGKAKDLATVNAHLDGIKEFIKVAVTGGELETSIDDKHPLYDGDGDKINVNSKILTIPKIDFGMIQEVDRPSVRSMYTDQPKIIADLMPDYDLQFVNNFKVGLLPAPFKDPNGQVDAGLLSFSSYNIDSKLASYNDDLIIDGPKKPRRVSLNSPGKGLDGIFNLKRAIGLVDYEANNGKTLHMANVHLSAFSHDKEKRNKEYIEIINLLVKWEEAGDYFVMGGDWNTDIMDAYYYTKAKNIYEGSGEDYSQSLSNENIFGYKYKINSLRSLDAFDIAKFPNAFRQFIASRKNTDKQINFYADPAINNSSIRCAGQRWQGAYATRNGVKVNAPFKPNDYVPTQATIDGFLTSSNITVDDINQPVITIQQGWHSNPMNPTHPSLYADSDHNPVIMRFKLN
ncbi:hypothetical protein [Candidatus Mycoplasma mahonii]|uniref:hypothetical protein n=1 Tax=Candidatus Mycoplasma mahonii TaxID=3004105 RepID=UPI0026EB6542|nr:hypothetical protein [Candidatus Mycoplasma mahonii]WKX02809.1 hypothetical protein O3I44_01920 [Candidatus Mycoplasma mahonii]